MLSAMKFLQLCLCSSLVSGGVSQLHAQQALAPEQQKQAIEALRKALDQPPGSPTESGSGPAGVKVIPPAETLPASAMKPVEKSAAPTSKDAEARAKTAAKLKARAAAEEKRLLEEEKRALEQQKRYEAKRQADLEAQARRDADLRARKEMKAKAGTEAPAPKTTPPIVVQTPAPPLTTAPAATTAVAATAPVLAGDQNSSAREALRRALEQAETPGAPATTPKIMVQPEVKPPAATIPGPVVVAPTPAVAPAATESKATAVVPVTPAFSQNQAEAARTALRLKLAEFEAATPVTPPENRPTTKVNVEKAAAPAGPAVPAVETKLPAPKSQRLADLLNSYRRDQITPAEYHRQRAKILAEPN